MSLRGRYIIDRIKRVVSSRIRMPVPPYGDPRFWDNVYNKMDNNPVTNPEEVDDSFEWGGIQLEDILEYQYHPVTLGRESSTGNYASSSTVSENLVTTTWGDTLGVRPRNINHENGATSAGTTNNDNNNDEDNTHKKEPLLMLGCGNSKMGEQMLDHGWGWPMIQVDIAGTALELLKRRTKYLNPAAAGEDSSTLSQRLQFVEEDATHLSALRSNSMHATVDKGLLDAFFCADEHDQMGLVVNSVLRVLQPGGVFCVLSFSRPEFIVPRLLPATASAMRLYPSGGATATKDNNGWQDLQIQQLDQMMIYRFQKSDLSKSMKFQEPKIRSRKKQ